MNESTTNMTDMETRLAQMVEKVLKGESSISIELGIEPEELEALYSLAYGLYNSGKYDEAMKMFGLLSIMAPLDERFIFGGASCAQMLGNYMLASMYYQLVAGVDAENPAPMLHTAECLLAMKDKEGAKIALGHAIARAKAQPDGSALLRRAEVMLENLMQ